CGLTWRQLSLSRKRRISSMDEIPPRRFAEVGGSNENPAPAGIALQWPHVDNSFTIDRPIDVRKPLVGLGQFIPYLVFQPVRIDAQYQELARVGIKAVGDPSHLILVGTVDETFRVKRFGPVWSRGDGIPNRRWHEV